MPIPLISKELLAKSKSCDNGWSLLQLNGIRSSAASSGKGVNTYFDFVALSGPGNSNDNEGRSITYMVSGAGLEAGVSDVINVYVQLLCALTGARPEELTGIEIEEEKLLGGKVWAEIGDRVYDGKTYKDIKCFSPADSVPF